MRDIVGVLTCGFNLLQPSLQVGVITITDPNKCSSNLLWRNAVLLYKQWAIFPSKSKEFVTIYFL